MSLEIDSNVDFKFGVLVSPSANRQFSALLDLCFPVSKGCRFFDDFPIWDPDLKVNQLIRFGIFLNDQLVCTCAVRRASLSWKATAAAAMPVSLIGAVATHPSWRGRGLASQLV